MFDAPSDVSFESFIVAQSRVDVLRFITCGSVDDGKSTLIGRLLHDANQLFEDQLSRLKRDSRRYGTQDGDIDYALLVDGLTAEREQGITIDVAYRFFATDKRCFVVADTPGHEQYTRNMATGASTADLAVLLVDARRGLSRQTRRHSLILSMLGVRKIVLAINKMDLVGWSQNRFQAVVAEYDAYSKNLGFADIVGIPMSALSGDNVVHPGIAAPWYEGPTLLQHLEGVRLHEREANAPFRFAVQWVNRRRSDFRGYAGLISSGKIRVGDRVRIQRSEQETQVARIVTYDGDLAEALAGESVTLTLVDDIDVSRGDVLASPDAARFFTDRLSARLFWTGEQPLVAGARFDLKLATATRQATVERVIHRIDPDSAAQDPADRLVGNDIGEIVLSLDWPLSLEPYVCSRDLGSFILIDRESFDTIALGLVHEPHQDGQSKREDEPEVEAKRAARSRAFWKKIGFGVLAIGAVAIGAHVNAARADTQLLNVSYDPTRELYREINQAFVEDWKARTGETVSVRASHGGSGAQARAVIDGIDADVVTLGIPSDIDAISKITKKISSDWRSKLPNNSQPYTSTIVLLVRKGNPKGIVSWADLARADVKVITPNPKTSAGGRWNFLAAWGYAYSKDKSSEAAVQYLTALYKNVPVLDTGARGSTVSFAQRGLGDVLPTWENEAFLVLDEFGRDKFDVVVPPTSIFAEPPVALVEGNVDRKGTRKQAEAYLQFLYADRAQAIFAKHHYRPLKREAARNEDLDLLPNVDLFTIESLQGSWDDIQKNNFESGGLFDKISKRAP
jgi:sulfate adenylyltransferase subunit 1